ncbi:FIG01046935: hypothetical protein CDS [Salmonella enterica subsp. enterica serovar Derby]|nr:FIG01046935: hypothetical protein CDS [Salmonella enterica subsp. enterica serovar Derby]
MLPLWFIGDIPGFICRYSVTNNLLIYNHFIKASCSVSAGRHAKTSPAAGG